MIEDELRAAFARHEADAPDPYTLRGRIDALARRRRRARTGRRMGAAAVAAVLAVTLAPVVSRQLNDPTTIIGTLLGTPTPQAAPTALNLLLLGLDGPFANNTAVPPQTGLRSDSITLVHIPADRQRVYLISLLRDLSVDIPGHGQHNINAAYYFGGAALSAQVVSQIAGVPIDGTVTVTLDATARITDQLGPIQVCLDVPTDSIHSDRVFPKGCQQLDGAAVSDLLRQRGSYPAGSFERDRTAQRVLLGVVTRLSELNLLTDAGKVSGLVSSGGEGVTVDLRPGSPALVQLALQLRAIEPGDVVGFGQPTFNPGPPPSRLEALRPEATELFSALRAGTLDRFAAAHPDWTLTG